MENLEKRRSSNKNMYWACTAALCFGALIAVFIGIFALESEREQSKETSKLLRKAKEIEQNYNVVYEVDSEYQVLEEGGKFLLSGKYLKVPDGTRIIREDLKEKEIMLPVGGEVEEILAEGSLRKLFINDDFEVSAISYVVHEENREEYKISNLSEEGELEVLHKHSIKASSLSIMFLYVIYVIVLAALLSAVA